MTTTERFNELAGMAFKRALELSKTKGEEYAGEVDRLDNFKRNAETWGIAMEQCWGVYVGKHWDAIRQYIIDVSNGKERTRAEPLEERVVDIIVYLLLFLCMLDERRYIPLSEQAPFRGKTMPHAVKDVFE